MEVDNLFFFFPVLAFLREHSAMLHLSEPKSRARKLGLICRLQFYNQSKKTNKKLRLIPDLVWYRGINLS